MTLREIVVVVLGLLAALTVLAGCVLVWGTPL
jgi:hypothetical protein